MSKKYWDIKPPYKPRTTKKRAQPREYPSRWIPGPVVIAPHPPICFPPDCLHSGCDHARNPVCMLSCPCRSCSQWLGSDFTTNVLLCMGREVL